MAYGHFVFYAPFGGPTGGTNFYTLGIGDSGQLLGYSTGSGPILMDSKFPGGFSAFLAGISASGIATTMNLQGQVVGSLQMPASGTSQYEAFVWNAGALTRIGVLNPGESSTATAINNWSEVVGFSEPPSPIYFSIVPRELATAAAFLWKTGTLYNLNQLLPPTTDWRLSTASAINDLGQIVGIGLKAGKTNGFIFNNGTVTDLGLSGTNLQVTGINNWGEVVGSVNGRAFFWSDGVLRDLNDPAPPNPAWVLQTAAGINDRGQIAGRGLSTPPPSGAQEWYSSNAVYRLTPVTSRRFEIHQTPSPLSVTLRIQYLGTTSNSFGLQSSTNLTGWTTIFTNGPVPGVTTVFETNNLGSASKFYRLVRLD